MSSSPLPSVYQSTDTSSALISSRSIDVIRYCPAKVSPWLIDASVLVESQDDSWTAHAAPLPFVPG